MCDKIVLRKMIPTLKQNFQFLAFCLVVHFLTGCISIVIIKITTLPSNKFIFILKALKKIPVKGEGRQSMLASFKVQSFLL